MENPRTDHILLEDMIPTAMAKARGCHLSATEATRVIEQNRGIIPVIVEPGGRYQVTWLDVQAYRFREWKFRYSVAAAIDGRDDVTAFTTDIDYLESPIQSICSNRPRGFIFQMSLCGSTLFAKALARSDELIVINEGTMLGEGLWSYLTDDWRAAPSVDPDRLSILRNLIMATLRPRNGCEQTGYVKFVSWNVVFIETIRAAFPDVPCIFLYRDPVEVLMSALGKRPVSYGSIQGTNMSTLLTGQFAAKNALLSDMEFYLSLYAAYFSAVLKSSPDNLRFLNYRDLTQGNFDDILRSAFGYSADPETLKCMQEQFNYYSKDDSSSTTFSSDTEEKRGSATKEMIAEVERFVGDLYVRLERSNQNLVQSLTGESPQFISP